LPKITLPKYVTQTVQFVTASGVRKQILWNNNAFDNKQNSPKHLKSLRCAAVAINCIKHREILNEKK